MNKFSGIKGFLLNPILNRVFKGCCFDSFYMGKYKHIFHVKPVEWNRNLDSFIDEYNALRNLKDKIESKVTIRNMDSRFDRKLCIHEMQDVIEADTYYRRFTTAELKSLGERYPKFTSESDVYIDKAKKIVYKSKDIFGHDGFKSHNPIYTIYEYLLHNILFPNVPYHLEGIGTRNGQVSLVFSQPYIDATEATYDEIDRYFELMKLEHNGYHEYSNEYFSIHDCCGANVLSDKVGGIYVIDPVINFKKDPREVFEYVYNLTDKDLERYTSTTSTRRSNQRKVNSMKD